ncbi:MAG: VTT domain-containing protein [Myxococcales bacterium]|nr:VTT domain-containing protein [Myxococcales bacterium]
MTQLRGARPWHILVALCAVLAVLAALTHRFVSLEAARDWTRALGHTAQQHALLTGAVFFGLLVLAMLFALPAKAVLNMMIAALLGFWPAVCLTLLGTLTGSSLLYAVTRRIATPSPLPPRWHGVQRRLLRRPLITCAALRLTPVLPYGPVTIACAMAQTPYRPFLLGSALGDIPIVALYALAGTRLMALAQTRDALTPTTALVLSAAALLLLLGAIAPSKRRDTPPPEQVQS